ncbi:MAG: DUF3617 family protein [Pseudomonadota bacterium]
MKSARSELLLVAIACLISVSAAHAQAPEPGEEWQMSMSMQMAGMSMPAHKANQCMPVSQKTIAPEPPDKNCTSTVISQTADTVNMKFSCTGKEAMEGTGSFTRTGKTMKGRMDMKTKDGDPMQINYSGENTGKACDAKAMQRTANAAIAQGAASVDKLCTDSASKGGQASMFFGKDAICKDAKYAPMYCANIKGEKGYSQLRYEEKLARTAGTPNLVPEIETACKTSLSAMNKQLCPTAEQRKSWKFLAQECEAEAKTLAAQQCAGRGYTAMSASPYKDFCSAFGAGAASGEVAAAPDAAAPPPAEVKPEDKVKKGLRSLKGALGL